MRRSSTSENSQRALTNRDASSATPIAAPTMRKPVCQPQKSSAAPSSNGGVLMGKKLRNIQHSTSNTQHPKQRPPVETLGCSMPARDLSELDVGGWMFSFQLRQILFNPTQLQRDKSFRPVAHRPNVERLPFSRRHDHQHHYRQAKCGQFSHKLASLLVPREQHTHATTHLARVIEHQMLQCGE